MTEPDIEMSNRILIVDDNPAIHEDFKKVLGAAATSGSEELDDFESALFGDEHEAADTDTARTSYEITSAYQGKEALELVREAREAGRPFAMAFVDVRMPPGWDGVETIAHLWEVDPDLQAVICTAFSDYTWGETIAKLGRSDRLLILKKPFDPVEACQIACALVEKWNVTLRERARLEQVRAAEQEARSYAASLETVNRALETTLATSEESSRAKSEFLLRVTDELLQPMAGLLGNAQDLDQKDVIGDDWLEMVGTLCREGGALRSTLTEIVDLSHIEAGELAVDLGRCEPRSVAREAIAEALARLGAPQSQVELVCTTPIPVSIHSDPARVRRIVAHLVRNALSRGGDAKVRVELSVERAESWQEPKLRVDVIDRGELIPHNAMGRLFEPFQIVGDLSLGLSLSRRVAHLLGGDLRVESEAETGTRLSLTVRTGALDGVSMLDAT